MKFKMPSDEFLEKNLLVDIFNGTISKIKEEKIKKNLNTWSSEDQVKLTWEIPDIDKISNRLFGNIEFFYYDEYDDDMPEYEYRFKGDKEKNYPNLYYYLRFLEERDVILVESMPFLLFCEFLSEYCKAFPDDLPLILVQSGDACLVRVTAETTTEDINWALQQDSDESWEAVE